jgi:hypothetical protein
VEGHSSRLEQVEHRISGLDDKMILNSKQKNSYKKNSRTEKARCKISVTPSKDQIYELWALKKEKKYKPK